MSVANEVPINSHIQDTIPLKKNVNTFLGLRESSEKMNRQDVTLFDGLFLEKHKRWGREIAIKVWDRYLR